MSSRLNNKIRRAHARGVHVFKWHGHVNHWDVYVEGELTPRTIKDMTKREAANLAYRIAVSKKPGELVVEIPCDQ